MNVNIERKARDIELIYFFISGNLRGFYQKNISIMSLLKLVLIFIY